MIKIDEKTRQLIDQKAFTLSGGDIALWHHHSALLDGEFRIHRLGEEHWGRWNLVKRFPQYSAVEMSVIEGWRTFIQNVLGIPREQQADSFAINRGLIFDGCRRSKNEAAQTLQERADSIKDFAANGDVHFFRSLGRLLGSQKRASLQRFDYAEAILSNWLASFLWLMPERTAADCLAGWRGRTPTTAKESDQELRHFKETKRDYKLKSHKPSLIHRIGPDGRLMLTPQGKSILRSAPSPRM